MKNLAAVVLFVMLGWALPTHADTLTSADAAWKEKSYARALPLYRAAQKQGKKRADINYRVGVCLQETQRWNEAIAFGQGLLVKNPKDAHILYWMGRLYADEDLPHYGYRIKKRVYRGDDYPDTKDSDEPEEEDYSASDENRVSRYLQDAKFNAQVTRRFGHPSLSRTEEAQLNFDLAAWIWPREIDRLVSAVTGTDRLERKSSPTLRDEHINPRDLYSYGWSSPKKALYLYNEIASLDRSKAALALLAKGLFVRSYRQRMDSSTLYYDQRTKKYAKYHYPFDHLEALPVWRELVKKYPHHPIAPQTQLLIARMYLSGTQHSLPRAVQEAKWLIAHYPKSKWSSDARSMIQSLEKRELSVENVGAQPPGKAAHLQIYTRNIKRVDFVVYRVALEKVLAANDRLANPKTTFTNFSTNFGTIAQARKYFGAKVAQWSLVTRNSSTHEGVSETITTPIEERGAYVVIASDGAKVQQAQVLILSDLAILKKADRRGSFAYVADARTGAPVAGANVVLKESWWGGDGKRHCSVQRGTSDAQGFADKKWANGQKEVAAFAYVGNRYAMTGAYWESSDGNYYGRNEGDNTRVYALTDRPVYRPEQEVHFRQIILHREKDGSMAPVKQKEIYVSIENPQGEAIFKKHLTTSEFGTINGVFKLPEDAPLGEYTINAFTDDSSSGSNRFRVEEYKRPEFQVSVEAPKKAMRPGQNLTALIHADYYFGGPVANAKVKYTVRRSRWYPQHHFPRAYDWLWSYWNTGEYDTGRRNIGGEGSGEVISTGTAATDAKGNAEVSFKTQDFPQVSNAAASQNYWNEWGSPLYTVEAEITDSSRRTIEAQGEVKVARQEYFAFLDSKRGYYQQGDRIPIEVATVDANDNTVAASGRMVAYRQLPGDKEQKVFETAIATSADKPTIWTWEAKQAGLFRIAYEATDHWGQKVRGSTVLWVAGEGLNTSAFRLQGVTLVVQNEQYQEGDTAKVLLVGDKPNMTVLLTQEVGGNILKREVVKIDGKSRELEIPIGKQHVPNFALVAATVRDFEVFSTYKELFVPPAKQLINVEVSGNKAQYKPGEKGEFTIKATDWQGKPARAEVSLALTDASLFYIQKSYAPDIRTFYYGDRRTITTQLDSSRSGRSESRYEDDNRYIDYETREWTLPDGMGMLELTPGNYDNYDGYAYDGETRRYKRSFDAMRTPARSRGGMEGIMASEDAVGAPAPPPAAPAPMQTKSAADEEPLAQAEVRSNFAETAFWSPAVVTNGGQAKVEVTFPDSLTTWHADARGLTSNAQVGGGDSDVRTKKDLILRLQAPRFFVERDEVTLSANVHNYLETEKKIKVSLENSPQLSGESTAVQWATVKPGEEARVDWKMKVVKDGEADIQMAAQTDEDADAVKMSFPVLVHGVQRFASQSGVLREGNDKTTVQIKLPAARESGASLLNVQLNPSLAATMMDALPYLADYPYGCVEQTLSRFVPTTVVQSVLNDSGVDMATVKKRAEAYAKEAKTRPIGERIANSGYTYPAGMPESRDLQEMASHLWFENRGNNPIYDPVKVSKMAAAGLARLQSMQRADGGWGWWQDSEESDPYMSANVVAGLVAAQQAGMAIPNALLTRGVAYLNGQMKDEDEKELLCQIGYSLSLRGNVTATTRKILTGQLYDNRDKLNPYTQSLLAMALWNIRENDKARVLARNLENAVRIDAANGTARWKESTYWWYWWNNDVETTAYGLRAFLKIDPKNKLVPMLAKWLVVNARGNHWNSTKETANVVYALANYVRVFKELDVDYTLTVRLGNKIQRTYRVTKDNALWFDNRFIVNDFLLADGDNTLTIEKQGRGNLYWSAGSEYFSREEPIKASGNQIAIHRRYFKLIPAKGKANKETTRVEIKDGETLLSGDQVEVELVIKSNNDYDYLAFEDMKPAGLEPVDLRSGSSWGEGLCSNVELRDEKVVFFVDNLPQGTRVLRYRMRAEIPGQFHALPTNGYAMYAPEVRAISDEWRLGVRD